MLKNNFSHLVRILIYGLFCLSFKAGFAHPGSGIVVDKNGNVYFTDTGKGIWKIDKKGKLIFLPSSRFHWMTLDESGNFASSPKNFGGYFEKVPANNSNSFIITCSDFTLTAHPDGNIYYVDTRPGYSRIMRRNPAGKETILITDKVLEFTSGICVGPDKSLYITEASSAKTNTIRKISMDGKITVIASFKGKPTDKQPTGTDPAYCRGLAVDEKGNIYVAASGSRRVLKISPAGQITEILNEPDPWSPTGIAYYNGEVYVLEWQDVAPELGEVREAWIPRVRKIGKDGKTITLATVSR